ncbi:MAG: VOC family protein [Lacrimispora sp.]|uniref:VOC family protein n=1 Tax=Lacrimispora sp. TaxID=2719234 RepID=UPI0039E35333
MIKPYIFFNGNCEEAFQLYANAFDGEIIHMQKYGEMPPNLDFPISEEEKNFVLHAQVSLKEAGVLMGADVARPLEVGTNINFSLEMTSEEAAKKAWDLLKEGGQVLMELEPSFFAKLHGSLQDKYGIIWLFSVS